MWWLLRCITSLLCLIAYHIKEVMAGNHFVNRSVAMVNKFLSLLGCVYASVTSLIYNFTSKCWQTPEVVLLSFSFSSFSLLFKCEVSKVILFQHSRIEGKYPKTLTNFQDCVPGSIHPSQCNIRLNMYLTRKFLNGTALLQVWNYCRCAMWLFYRGPWKFCTAW